MQIALNLVRWDIQLQFRSHLYSATVLTTLAFCLAVFLLRPFDLSSRVLSFLLLTDPAVIGLTFVGAFILMERGGGTLPALAVSPMPGWTYVFGKIVSFSILGTLSGAIVAVAASIGQLNYGAMALSLVLTNALAVLLGFVIAAPAKSVNNFLVRMALAMTVVMLPSLPFLGLTPGVAPMILAIIPTYSMLVTLEAGFADNSVSAFEYAGHCFYLLAWIAVGWFWSLRQYDRFLRTTGA